METKIIKRGRPIKSPDGIQVDQNLEGYCTMYTICTTTIPTALLQNMTKCPPECVATTNSWPQHPARKGSISHYKNRRSSR